MSGPWRSGLRYPPFNGRRTRPSVPEDGIMECSCDLPVFGGITTVALVDAVKGFIRELKSVSALLGDDSPDPSQGTDHEAGFPQEVLRGVSWSFIGKPFADRDAFDREVRQYQLDIREEDSWRPDEVVIRSPRIRV